VVEIMNEEMKNALIVPVRILTIVPFVLAYVVGGRKHKWIRRFLGAALLAAAVMGFAYWVGRFTWWLLPAFIPMAIGLSLGYGGTHDPSEKVAKRFVYGVVIGLTGVAVGLVTGNIFVGTCQLAIATAASVFYGVFNPLRAVEEEGVISTLSVILIPFMI
jgi:hypothetical protein